VLLRCRVGERVLALVLSPRLAQLLVGLDGGLLFGAAMDAACATLELAARDRAAPRDALLAELTALARQGVLGA
jgi:hypothetical protein